MNTMFSCNYGDEMKIGRMYLLFFILYTKYFLFSLCFFYTKVIRYY